MSLSPRRGTKGKRISGTKYVLDKKTRKLVKMEDVKRERSSIDAPAIHIYKEHYNWSAGEVFRSRADEKSYMQRTNTEPID